MDLQIQNQAQSSEGATQAVAARQVEQVRAAMLVAKHFPRDEIRADTKLRESCQRSTFAARALYSFPRGGATVTGASVYMAREAARLWGNIEYGIDILPSDSGMVHIEAWARDLETNTRVAAQDRFKKLVQRRTWDEAEKKKIAKWVEPDERDLRELVNRRGAIHVRNCILQLLPSDIIEGAAGLCELTMRQAADGKLKGNRKDEIRKLLAGFSKIGVSQDMVEGYLDHSIADISPDQYAELVQIGQSIRDGNTRREEHFEVGKKPAEQGPSQGVPPKGLDDLADALKSKAAVAEPEPETAEALTEEPGEAPSPPSASFFEDDDDDAAGRHVEPEPGS